MILDCWGIFGPKKRGRDIDFVIPSHEKDAATLRLVVDGVRKNRSCRNVYIISEKKPSVDNAAHIAESEFDPMFCKESIRAEWTRRYPVFAWRAGWLYQQLLKLMCFKVISGLSESFVVVDSDTIFLRDVPFVPGKYYFCKTKEYHPPYLPPIRALLGVVETIGFSCVTHHSIFNSRFLQAMIGEIEARHRLPLVEAILRHLDFSEPSCFSEWDLYANYMILRHPKVTRRRQLRWADIKEQPSSVQLAAYAKKYDFVSCHAYLRSD